MKLEELFCDFCFHDGELVNVVIDQNDIIMSFSLPSFLQTKKLKEYCGIDEAVKTVSLELEVKFNHFSNFKSEPLVMIDNIDLDEYELWCVQADEQNQEIIMQLRKFGADNLLTLSFACQSVEVISCEFKS